MCVVYCALSVLCGVWRCAGVVGCRCVAALCSFRVVSNVRCELRVVRLCRCVGQMCGVCTDANRVVARGGIEAVVAAMRRHEGVADVAEQGCRALWIIATLGGCSAAVCARAVRRCARVGQLQCGQPVREARRRACARLCVLCARTWWWVVDERQGRVRACGRAALVQQRRVRVCVCALMLARASTSLASLPSSVLRVAGVRGGV